MEVWMGGDGRRQNEISRSEAAFDFDLISRQPKRKNDDERQ